MNKPIRTIPARRQRGAALLVVMLLLLIMTLLGLASLRSTLNQERMGANVRDRSLGFESAEAGLRQAETWLQNTAVLPAPTADCSSLLCDRPTASAVERWLNPSFTAWRNGTAVLGAGTPQYFIELMGPAANWPGCDQEIPMHPNCLTPRYRITSRNNDPALGIERAQVVLQSNYAAAIP